MDDAFAYFTDIRLRFTERQEMPEFMTALARLLSKANGLTCLQLELDCVLGNRSGVQWQDLDLLTEINNCARWSTITDLCLTGFSFSETTILHTLSLAASSLESITLMRCRLLGEDTWPHCYEGMRRIPFRVLNHLDFRTCYQCGRYSELLDTLPHYWSIENFCARSVVIHRIDDPFHLDVGYSSSIYDYILKKTESKPPLQKITLRILELDSKRHVDIYRDVDDMYLDGSRWPYWY